MLWTILEYCTEVRSSTLHRFRESFWRCEQGVYLAYSTQKGYSGQTNSCYHSGIWLRKMSRTASGQNLRGIWNRERSLPGLCLVTNTKWVFRVTLFVTRTLCRNGSVYCMKFGVEVRDVSPQICGKWHHSVLTLREWDPQGYKRGILHFFSPKIVIRGIIWRVLISTFQVRY